MKSGRAAEFFAAHFLRKKSSSQFQIDALDGLRGIAVLYVLLHHMSYQGLHVLPFMRFAGAGKAGVYLFFTLSSFLLTFPLVQPAAPLNGGIPFWGRYFLRRYFRVYPLFIAALGFNYAAGHFFQSKNVIEITGGDLLPHLTLRVGREIFWTIAVEFKYYFIIPLFAIGYAGLLRRSLAAISLVTVGVLAAGALWWWPSSGTALNTIRLGPYLPIFLLGSLTAVVQTSLNGRGGVKSGAVRGLLETAGWGLLLFSLILIPSIWERVTGQAIVPDHFSKHYLMFGLMWAAFILCLLNGRGLLDRFLCWDPLRFLGVISFSIYIWHLPVIRFADGFLPGPYKIRVVLVLLATVLVSSVSYLFLEKPFLKIVRSAKRNTPAAGEAAS